MQNPLSKLFPAKSASNWNKNIRKEPPVGHPSNPLDAVKDVTEKDIALMRYPELQGQAAYGKSAILIKVLPRNSK